MSTTIRDIGERAIYVSETDNLKAALEEATRSGADLSRADLSRANLGGANLGGANLGGADLSRADLSRANLSGANLSGANLSGAYLYGADLYGADLRGADLYVANLSWADLGGANLCRANLSRAMWLKVAEALRSSLTAMNDGGRHWIKGSLQGQLDDGSATYCSIGSVRANAEDGTAQALSLWLLTSVTGGDIAAFNDHGSTEWDDVVAAFELAIKHAKRFAA